MIRPSSIREKLIRRIAERVFLDAQKDLATDELGKPRRVSVIALVLSVLVLASPFVSLFIGLGVVAATFPSPIGLFVGLVAVALGLALMPWPVKLEHEILRRDEMPASFECLDQLAHAMGTDKLTGIHILDDFNGYMLHHRGERILGVGALLWTATTNEERLAFLAHEFSHQINGDPARYGLTSKALRTLEGWLWYLEPDGYDWVAELMMVIPYGLAAAIYRLLLRLTIIESQRAEYLADAIGSRISGVDPAISLLQKLAWVPGIEAELNTMHGASAPGGLEMVARLSSAVTDMPRDKKEKLTNEMMAEMLSVDTSHPPSAYRIAFLDLVENAEHPIAGDFSGSIEKMDRELAPHFAKCGDRMQSELREAHGL